MATFKNYTVKKGDTLTRIAKEFNTTVNEIAKLNNIKNVDLINIGQVLTIPVAGLKYEDIGRQLEKVISDIDKLPSVQALFDML